MNLKIDTPGLFQIFPATLNLFPLEEMKPCQKGNPVTPWTMLHYADTWITIFWLYAHHTKLVTLFQEFLSNRLEPCLEKVDA